MSVTTLQPIAIAGAGLLGRLLAWRLLRAGFAVTLYEAGALTPSPAAARTAAGMISPLSEAVVSDVTVYQMGLYALEIWPQWLADIETQSAEDLFSRNGSLVITHSQDLNELRQFEQELRHVLGDEIGYRHLNQAEIHQLEPDLNPAFSHGVFLENEGHIHNRQLLDILLNEIQTLGGQCKEHCPVEVAPHTIRCGGEATRYDLVIDCRGTGAKTQQSQLRGVRGETLHVQTSEVRLQRPVRLMHPRYQLYVVPKPNQCFVIGATQIESEDRSPISLQSSLELSSALYTLSPAFAEARILEMDVNLRPAYMDNFPRVHAEPGLITANGLFRHGYLLAPAVVTDVLSLITVQEASPFHRYFEKPR